MESHAVGRYKVAYWREAHTVHSAMFDSADSAGRTAEDLQKSGYVVTVMELQDVQNGRYVWKLLKGGISPFFGVATFAYRHRLLWGSLVLLAYLSQRKSR